MSERRWKILILVILSFAEFGIGVFSGWKEGKHSADRWWQEQPNMNAPEAPAGIGKPAPRVGYWVAPCWNPKGEKVDCPPNTTGTMIIPDSGIGKPQVPSVVAPCDKNTILYEGKCWRQPKFHIDIVRDCIPGQDSFAKQDCRSKMTADTFWNLDKTIELNNETVRILEGIFPHPSLAHPLKLGKRKPAPQQGGCTPEMGPGCAFIDNSPALNQVNIEYKWCEQIRNNCGVGDSHGGHSCSEEERAELLKNMLCQAGVPTPQVPQ